MATRGRIPPRAFAVEPIREALPMSAYQGIRIFSSVVLGLMGAGIAYAAYIAVTYWTGISV